MKLRTAFFLAALAAASCKDEVDIRTASGRMLYARDSTPAANVAFKVYAAEKDRRNGQGEINVPFTTNAAGEFNVEVDIGRQADAIGIYWPWGDLQGVGLVAVVDFQGKKALNIGDVYVTP